MTSKKNIFRSGHVVEYSQHICINAEFGKLLAATNRKSEDIPRLIFNNRNQLHFTIIVTKPANLPLHITIHTMISRKPSIALNGSLLKRLNYSIFGSSLINGLVEALPQRHHQLCSKQQMGV